jgi:hypothetical protein
MGWTDPAYQCVITFSFRAILLWPSADRPIWDRLNRNHVRIISFQKDSALDLDQSHSYRPEEEVLGRA